MLLDAEKGNTEFRTFKCHHCGYEGKPEATGKVDPQHGYALGCAQCKGWLGWSGKSKALKDAEGKRVEASIWTAKRLKIEECQYCRRPKECLGDRERLEVHHVVPVEDDGPDSPENIWVVCTSCHKEIHHRRIYFNSHMAKFFLAYTAYQQRAEREAK